MDDATKSVIRHLLQGEWPVDGWWAYREAWPDIATDGDRVTPEENAVFKAAHRAPSLFAPPRMSPEVRRWLKQAHEHPWKSGLRRRQRQDPMVILAHREFIYTRWLRVRWNHDPIMRSSLRLTLGRFEFVLAPIPKGSWTARDK